MRLRLILMLVCTVCAHSRPIMVPSYQELQDRADMVLILKVQAITTREPRRGEMVDTNFYQCYTAECKVMSVLKGRLEQTVLSIPFFQHPEGIPGFNGAIAAPFSMEGGLAYLAFMKRDPWGQLVPVTGDYDAGLSIKMMFEWHPNPRHVKLPPPPAKPAQPGVSTEDPGLREQDLINAATNLIDIVRETKDPEAKWRAIRTLWDLRRKEAAPLLLECLKDPHHYVRANAARALGDMRIKQASGPLIQLLEHEKDGGVIEQTSLALSLLQAHEAVPVLKRCANHESIQTRMWVLQAIGNLGSRADLPFLGEHLDSSDTSEQEMAAEAIENIAKVDFEFPKGSGLHDPRAAIQRAKDWWEKNKSAFQSK